MEAKGVAVSNGVPATVLQGGGLDLSLANQGFNSIDILADCFVFCNYSEHFIFGPSGLSI